MQPQRSSEGSRGQRTSQSTTSHQINNNPSTTNSAQPFYEVPSNRVLPAQIIEDSRTYLQTVFTQRPFTPRETNSLGSGGSQRRLFSGKTTTKPLIATGGTSSSKASFDAALDDSRPPSAFSLSGSHFENAANESRPPSGTRLTPINHKPRLPSEESAGVSGVAMTINKTKRQKSVNESSATTGGNVVFTEESSRRQSIPVEKSEKTSSNFEVRKNKLKQTKLSIESTSDSAGSSRGNSAELNTSSDRLQRHDSTGSSSNTDDFYEKQIIPILNLLSAPTSIMQDLIALTETLYMELERGNLLARNCRHRSNILKILYGLLDKEDARLYVGLSKIILSLHVSGENLTNVCKLIFRVAKEHSNDEFFSEYKMPSLLVESLHRITNSRQQLPYDTLVYLIGSIKCLTNNTKLSGLFYQNGLINVLMGAQHSILQQSSTSSNVEKDVKSRVGNKSQSNNSPGDRMNHVLELILATCYNVYKQNEKVRTIFLGTNKFLNDVCMVLDRYSHDIELVSYISRLLSRLTLHSDACEALANQMNFCHIGLNLLQKYYDRENVVIHLAFTLGNLAARHENSRISLFPDKSKLDMLLSVFMNYWKIFHNQPSPVEPYGDKEIRSGTSQSAEDVLVKLVRVIANCALSDAVGQIIASSKTCLGLLLGLIGSRKLNESEDLILNTISTVNNITYYLNEDVCQDYEMRLLKVAEALMNVVLQEQHMEALKGAIRVFGNLSRSPIVRKFIVDHKLSSILITLLDSNHVDLVYGSVGVLLNLTNDPDKRDLLMQDGGVSKLIEVLRDFGSGSQDWKLATLVCQTIWNYTESMGSTENAMGGVAQAQEVIDLLTEFTDRESVEAYNHSGGRELEVVTFLQEIWSSEFYPVATSLLQRLEEHQSPLEPI